MDYSGFSLARERVSEPLPSNGLLEYKIVSATKYLVVHNFQKIFVAREHMKFWYRLNQMSLINFMAALILFCSCNDAVGSSEYLHSQCMNING
jgi:hypothetical protein